MQHILYGESMVILLLQIAPPKAYSTPKPMPYIDSTPINWSQMMLQPSSMANIGHCKILPQQICLWAHRLEVPFLAKKNSQNRSDFFARTCAEQNGHPCKRTPLVNKGHAKPFPPQKQGPRPIFHHASAQQNEPLLHKIGEEQWPKIHSACTSSLFVVHIRTYVA